MITKFKYIICGICVICGSMSCSDMLESDSSRQVFDPSLDAKTDSVFYTLGILQGMQELADQYVFQGELRGDLTATTPYTDKNLRQLANFTATAANKYDSAYVYYRVINNCNYYITHRDTTLRTGSEMVVMKEYVAIKAIRAWAYMQLGRIYEKVPFTTVPLTQISQINDGNFEILTLSQIVERLAPDLEQYTGYNVPTYSKSTPSASSFSVDKILIPVDVVLGDMYLETGQYDKAANHYITYLTQVATENTRHSAYMQVYSSNGRSNFLGDDDDLPSDWDNTYNAQNRISSSSPWANIFTSTSSNDIISYIPFAPSSQQGVATAIPKAFGYDYYANNSGFVDEIQILPSESYISLSNSQDYYYFSTLGSTSNPQIGTAKLGDTRFSATTRQLTDSETDSTTVWITKYNQARVILYRNTTVLMHLAEAFNRLGMYDAAFAILKDGISSGLLASANNVKLMGENYYVSDETLTALQTTYPLLSSANISKFNYVNNMFGIHCHGTGFAFDHYGSEPREKMSPYQMDTIVAVKMKNIAVTYGITVGNTPQDTINAVEDLLCDEYALEFAFEGSRFFDLCRLARHKNAESPASYGAKFGSKWLASKLAFKASGLEDESKWYLPFK